MASNQKTERRRLRKTYSCEPCRKSKLRCDRQAPCALCKHRGCESSCTYKGKASLLSPRGSPQPTQLNLRSGDQPVPGSTAATPGHQDVSHARWNAVFERPVQSAGDLEPQLTPQSHDLRFPFALGPKLAKEDLLSKLPPWQCCEYLITRYFTVLSPLFHVLHGPTFEQQYYIFKDNPSKVDLSWLALLFLILSMAVYTVERDDDILVDVLPELQDRDTTALSHQLRVTAMVCLAQDNFLVNHTLNTLEALLILIFTISHDEGADRGWVLLGMCLNIGIALRCNSDIKPPGMSCIEVERHRRCWAGILLLHTYQAVIFRDVDMGWLTQNPAVIPADVNDVDIQEHIIVRPSSQPTQMSVVMFKLRLCQISNRICSHLSKPMQLGESDVRLLGGEIAAEQHKWDKAFLSRGRPRLLDTSSYASWSVLQLCAHHLYLLLHWPFCRSNSVGTLQFRPESRAQCISSGATLLDLHRQFFDSPRLRHYRWVIYGVTSSYALHGAVALASCLLDQTDGNFESGPYRSAFDAALIRVEKLQDRSPICKKAYPILRHFQTMLSPDNFQWSDSAGVDFGNTFEGWIDSVQWLNPDSINWEYWDAILNVGEALV